MTYGRKQALEPDGTKKGVGECGWEKPWQGEPDGSSGRLLDGRSMREGRGKRGRRVLDWRRDGRVLEWRRSRRVLDWRKDGKVL